MKRIYRITFVLMLLAILVSTMSLTAFAESVYFNGTVGESETFWIHTDYDTTVDDCAIVNGDVPGMHLSLPNPASVCLEGTPTKAGTYTIYVSVTTSAGMELEYTVTVSIDEAKTPTEAPKPSDGTPKITKHPTGEKVIEGDSAVFIAKADNVRQYAWEITIADAVLDCTQLPTYLGKNVKVSGANSEQLVLSNIPKELNGSYVRCRFIGAEESVYSEYAKITVTPLSEATPKVTKHPTSETVEEGGEAVFIAKAKYTQIYTWQLISPEGIIFDCETVHLTFPELKVTGAKTETVVLSNIPLELNGYKIRCMFTAGDAVVSDPAKLTVTAKPTQPPTEEPTEAPTEATVEATEAPETQPSEEKPQENNDNPADVPSVEQPEPNTGNSDGGGRTLLIVLIICAAAVAIATIAAVTILILKKPKW